ncbi:MAG: hypothetical protein ACKOW2_01730 [Sphingobacteriaceae bacterium]
MTAAITFVEKQYLGRDYNRISIRLVMALFCFAAYFVSENDANAELFLVVGFGILLISVLMMFLMHFRTTVQNKSVILDGLWTTKLVKIDLNSITKVERLPYSKFLINNPVYNLHKNGMIRFYAGGKDAVYLYDGDGLIYVIGTQHADELLHRIKDAMKK